MKSNYGTVNRAELKKEVLEIAERMVNEREAAIREEVQNSVSSQVLAVTFWVLHKECGWGKKRLSRLKNQIEDAFVLMHKRPMGAEITPIDLREWLKETYGVDFEETQYKGGID